MLGLKNHSFEILVNYKGFCGRLRLRLKFKVASLCIKSILSRNLYLSLDLSRCKINLVFVEKIGKIRVYCSTVSTATTVLLITCFYQALI
jgi:hypothetical protein